MGKFPAEAIIMDRCHNIKNIRFEFDHIIIEVDDQTREFDLEGISPRLAMASEVERNTFEISPSGYGIHWPLIDEDLSIDAILRAKLKTSTHIRN
jgi:hypothetical protein